MCMPNAARARGDELADAAEAEQPERLLVELDAAELRALPAAPPSATRAPAGRCARARASARSCARRRRRCSTAARWRRRSRAWSRPRTSTLSTPMPARPITFRLLGALDQLGVELRGRADQEAVVVADALGELARASSRSRGRRRSARAAASTPESAIFSATRTRSARRGRRHAAARTPASRNTLCAAPTPAPCSTSWPSWASAISRPDSDVRMSKAPK